MKKVYTAKDIEALIKNGKTAADIPAGALLTPSAKDALKDAGASPCAPAAAAQAESYQEPTVPNFEYNWTPGSDPKTPGEIAALFNSPEIVQIKSRMVDIGRRMWQRQYTDGNGGNLTVRVGDNLALCTPTLVSKGHMEVEDICLTDLDGKQLAGRRKRTSEALTHYAVMKAQPKAKSCCHAHPVHATAYAVARMQPPTCMIPEAEIFLGQIGMAEYKTPGSPENAIEVGRVAKDHMSVIMINHGVITWGKDIEDSYWKMENTESYCRVIWVASQLGGELSTITGAQAKELIALRKSLGMDDPREGLRECELCDNAEFRPGVVCRPAEISSDCGCDTKADACAAPGADETLVRQITDMIMQKLGS